MTYLFLCEIQLLYWSETLDKVVKIGFDREVTKIGDTDGCDVITTGTRGLTAGTTTGSFAQVWSHVFVGGCGFRICE